MRILTLFPDNMEPKMLDPAWESVSSVGLEGKVRLALWPLRGVLRQTQHPGTKAKEIPKELNPRGQAERQSSLVGNL